MKLGLPRLKKRKANAVSLKQVQQTHEQSAALHDYEQRDAEQQERPRHGRGNHSNMHGCGRTLLPHDPHTQADPH
jgi:septal ring factor EnvC (AmiA/AmiB activator)